MSGNNKQAIDFADRALGFVTFENFMKVDIRVGVIISAEPVPKSEKLLKLEVNFGDFQRTIVAGLGEKYKHMSAFVNHHALFVVNLPPRKLMGIESHGMILAASLHDGPYYINVGEWMTPGAKIG